MIINSALRNITVNAERTKRSIYNKQYGSSEIQFVMGSYYENGGISSEGNSVSCAPCHNSKKSLDIAKALTKDSTWWHSPVHHNVIQMGDHQRHGLCRTHSGYRHACSNQNVSQSYITYVFNDLWRRWGEKNWMIIARIIATSSLGMRVNQSLLPWRWRHCGRHSDRHGEPIQVQTQELTPSLQTGAHHLGHGSSWLLQLH